MSNSILRFDAGDVAEVARNRFSYNPETGALVWKNCRKFPSKNGNVVGSKNGGGHLMVPILGCVVSAHRLIWLMQTGSWPADQVDHANRNKADNRWLNLRIATASQNSSNRVSKANSTGFKCVHKITNGSSYWYRFKHNSKSFYGYGFKTAEEAYKAMENRAIPMKQGFYEAAAKVRAQQERGR